MQVKFKYPRRLGEQLYRASKEYQDVPDVFCSGWFFDALVKAKEVEVKPAPVVEVSLEQSEAEIETPKRGRRKKEKQIEN